MHYSLGTPGCRTFPRGVHVRAVQLVWTVWLTPAWPHIMAANPAAGSTTSLQISNPCFVLVRWGVCNASTREYPGRHVACPLPTRERPYTSALAGGRLYIYVGIPTVLRVGRSRSRHTSYYKTTLESNILSLKYPHPQSR